MNRFFRTAYATTLVYLSLALFGVLISGVRIPFLAFSCLYFGLLLSLLPGVSQRLSGKERLFYLLGAMTAVLGFLPLALWHSPMIHWIIHLLGIAAAGAFLSILRHRTTHGIFLAKYEFTAVSLLILIGLIYLAILTGIYQGGQAAERSRALSRAMSCVVPYAIVLLASGVLLLRGLRAQPGMADEQAFIRRQLRDTLIFAVLVTLIFAVDPFIYLQKAVYFLLNDLLRPSARYLVQFLDMLLRSVSRREQPAAETLPPEETADPGVMQVIEPAETEPEQYFIEGNDLSLTVAYILLAAAALALLFLLAAQIRKLVRTLRARSRNRGSGYPNETREMLPVKEETSREGKPKKRSSDPRERIRYLYGEFLRCLRKLRVRFSKTETCGEIRHHAETHSIADPATLSDLTMLYERARYRLKETPTEADAHLMKDLLDRIRGRS